MKRAVNSQRRIASKILKCGVYRVWMDPKAMERITKGITRTDIRGMIDDGIIKKVPAKKTEHRIGRKQREGSRKGTRGAREGKKARWFKVVRPQRKLLSELKKNGELEKGIYRIIYRKIKGNEFRSKAHLMSFLKDKKFLKQKEK